MAAPGAGTDGNSGAHTRPANGALGVKAGASATAPSAATCASSGVPDAAAGRIKRPRECSADGGTGGNEPAAGSAAAGAGALEVANGGGAAPVDPTRKRQRTCSSAGAGAGAGAAPIGSDGGTSGGCSGACGGGGARLEAAHYGHKGTRRTMQDEHVIMFDAEIRARFRGIMPGPRLALFGVFDGHGGKNIATFVKGRLPDNIFAALEACTKKKLTSSFVKKALAKAFAKTDAESQAAAVEHGWTDGSCAVCALVVGERVYIANLGDSKAVLCLRTPSVAGAASDGGPADDGAAGTDPAQRPCPHEFHSYACACKAVPPAIAKPLTQDHKPILVEERRRIEASGGRVEGGRVNGKLEVARTFGDLALKRFGVVAEPDLRIHFKLTPECEFLVLACDGMWTRHTEVSCIAKCRSGILAARDHRPCQRADCVQPEHGWTLQRVAQWVIKDVVHNMGCQDNVTLLLIRFTTTTSDL